MDIEVAKKVGSRILRVSVLFFVFIEFAERAAVVTGHRWVGVASMAASLAVLLGALIKLRLNVEELSLRSLLIGILGLVAAQVSFVAAVRMPHSVASSLVVIAVIAGLPFINGESKASAPKQDAAESGDATKATESLDA